MRVRNSVVSAALATALFFVHGGAALAQSPAITITHRLPGAAPGVFLVAYPAPSMMIDNDGHVVWQQSSDWIDFKRAALGYTAIDTVRRRGLMLDARLRPVEERLVIGYPMMDIHEFKRLDNGDAWYFAYQQRAPLPAEVAAGVAPTATIISTVVQAQDMDKNLIFEWADLDHLPITGTTVADLKAAIIDPYHGNSIDFDYDGDILVSFRNSCSIAKIDRATGAVIWRLGGLDNDFAGDVQFCTQHDFGPATLSRGTNGPTRGFYTLFDNTGARGLKIELNQITMVATETVAYVHDQPIYAFATGSVQELPNGNVLVGWGTNPAFGPNFGPPVSHLAFTEFAADGRIILDGEMTMSSYRVRKFERVPIYYLPVIFLSND